MFSAITVFNEARRGFIMINSDTVLQLSHKFRLQWEESQQNYVLLFAEGMVTLNNSSSEILLLCDGKRNVSEIINTLQQKFQSEEIENDVREFLAIALQKGWVVSTDSH